MSVTSSIPKPELEKDTVICGWKVIRKLGCGGFGSVYEVMKDGMSAALKTEFIDQEGERSETLRNEVYQLRVMQWSSYFCRLYLACRLNCGDVEMNIMIMSLVGRPLSRMRRMTPEQRFTHSTSVRLAQQCLQAIIDLHNTGILHRDIKASNFAWSPERKVYLLDLGFCRRFLVWKNGKITYRVARKRAPFLGTSKYCSVNVHKRKEQGRRDDLWGWLYMVVEFFAGRLVWRNDDDDVIVQKKETIGSSLLKRCPQEMFIIYDHIRSLEYTSKPNYDLMRKQLEKICARHAIIESYPYDWEEGGRHFAAFNGRSDTEREMSDNGRKTLQTAIDILELD